MLPRIVTAALLAALVGCSGSSSPAPQLSTEDTRPSFKIKAGPIEYDSNRPEPQEEYEKDAPKKKE